MIKVGGLDVYISNCPKFGPCIFVLIEGKSHFLTYYRDSKEYGDLSHQAYCAMYYHY